MGVEVRRGLVYGTVPGFRPLRLDLHLGPRPRALCLWLHGGGWRVGARSNGPGPAGSGSRQLTRMAERGLAVAAADYRLSGEARFPAQLHDVGLACRFLADGGAPTPSLADLPLVLWGTSAGAHLAGLWALSEPAGQPVVAVASWSAPADLLSLADDLDQLGERVDRTADSREALLLGAPPHTVPDLARRASPAHQARPTDTSFLLVHGTADRHIPMAQTERYDRALSAAGAPVRTVLVHGADHFYGSISDDTLDALVDDTVDFLLAAADHSR